MACLLQELNFSGKYCSYLTWSLNIFCSLANFKIQVSVTIVTFSCWILPSQTNQVLNHSPQASQLQTNGIIYGLAGNEVKPAIGQRPPAQQMKKTQSPLIIRPGHIRRLNTNSGDRTPRDETPKHCHKSQNPALRYIAGAAKKVRGVFSFVFFQRKKADPRSGRDQVQPETRHYYQAGESPSKLMSFHQP